MSMKLGDLVICVKPTSTTTAGESYYIRTNPKEGKISITNDNGNFQVISSSRFIQRSKSTFRATNLERPTRMKEYYYVNTDIESVEDNLTLVAGDFLYGRYGVFHIIRETGDPRIISRRRVNSEYIRKYSESIIQVEKSSDIIKALRSAQYRLNEDSLYEFSDGTYGGIRGTAFPFLNTLRILGADNTIKIVWKDGKWLFNKKRVYLCKSYDDQEIYDSEPVVIVTSREIWTDTMRKGMEKDAKIILFKDYTKADKYFQRNKFRYSTQNIEDAFMNYFSEKDIDDCKKFLEEIEDIE